MKSILKLLFATIFTTVHWLLFCNLTFSEIYTCVGEIDSIFSYIILHIVLGMSIILHIYFYVFTLSFFTKFFKIQIKIRNIRIEND